MEIIPELKEKVIYPKGVPIHRTTLFNIKVRELHRSLINKLPNEFKYTLSGYNHRNTRCISWYIDTNNYNHF